MRMDERNACARRELVDADFRAGQTKGIVEFYARFAANIRLRVVCYGIEPPNDVLRKFPCVILL